MKCAYVTVLCGGDAYLPGVEALGSSLRASGTSLPRVVMVTADVSEDARTQLRRQGWEMLEVEPLENPTPETSRLFPRFGQVFTKLRVWTLEEFDKLVFLDADTIVLRNVDELFDRPYFAAAPDFFVPDRFNSGVMVLTPSAATFAAMTEALARAPSYDGGDQGFLNDFFAGWYAMPVAHRLPSCFNVHHFVFQFLASHPSLREQFLKDVRIVHYTLQKPWLHPTLAGGSEVWWQMFGGAHPEKDTAWRRRVHQLEDWSFESLVHALGG